MAASTAARDAGLTHFAPVRTREIVALGGELAALSELVGGTVRAKVAILCDWESFWAQDLEWHPSADPGHRRQIEASYSRLGNDGMTTDFAHPESDLSRDEVVLEGATAVVGYRTGASAGRPSPATASARERRDTSRPNSTPNSSRSCSATRCSKRVSHHGCVRATVWGSSSAVQPTRSSPSRSTTASTTSRRHDVTTAGESAIVLAPGAVSISRRPVGALGS